jgi:hypothetical protein
MEVNVTVNTKGMEAACAALAKLTGKSMQDVVDAELAKILDKTIDGVPSANAAAIRRKFAAAQYSAQSPTLYIPTTRAGSKARANARRTKNGKILYNLNNRYPLALWSAIQRSRTKSLQAKLLAIGLSKKSFWLIGRALGLPVKGGRFTQAIASTGKNYPQDIAVSRKSTSDGIQVSFINAQPTVNTPRVGGARALQNAINGRVQFFTTNVKKGVFNSMAQIARAYPGLHLTGGN